MLALAAPAAASAQEAGDTVPRLSFGAFIDGCYPYDTSRPASRDRAFTTQAARHNEFAVNLAFIEARYNARRACGWTIPPVPASRCRTRISSMSIGPINR